MDWAEMDSLDGWMVNGEANPEKKNNLTQDSFFSLVYYSQATQVNADWHQISADLTNKLLVLIHRGRT